MYILNKSKIQTKIALSSNDDKRLQTFDKIMHLKYAKVRC